MNDSSELSAERLLAEVPGSPPEISAQSVFVRRLAAHYPLNIDELFAAQQLVSGLRLFAQGADIIREGETPSTVAVLITGLAVHFRDFDIPRRQLTSIVVPGDICDFGFLASRATDQGLIALTPSVVGYIDLVRLSALVENVPNLLVAMIRGAGLRHASAQEMIVSLGSRDAMARLAHFFAEMHHRHSTVGLVRDDNSFDFPMTQVEIAETLGLSTVHLNRTIQALRRQGLIATGNGLVSIRDLSGLIAKAGFNPRYLLAGGAITPR